MEIAVGATAALLSTAVAAKYAKWRVNCWFCNHNIWVPIKERHSFTCKLCHQYNGFNQDGGYDKVIKEQHREGGSTRYARNERRSRGGSDDVMCDKCNEQMELQRRALSHWDAVNEANWESELADYKRRLERVYPLCEKCIMSTQRRLQANKQEYSQLLKLSQKANSLVSGLSHIARKIKPTSRRRFFSGGSMTTNVHLLSLAISFILLLALFDNLLVDLSISPLPIPSFFSSLLEYSLSHSQSLSIVVFFSHIISLFTNTNRISFSDLLSIPLSALLIHSLSSPLQGDSSLVAVAISSSLFILLSAVALLPRKKKHRKRTNNPISSAFSVASTPRSQVSSQADMSHLPSPSFIDYSFDKDKSERWMERARENHVQSTSPTAMDWQPSEINSPVQRRPLSMRNGEVYTKSAESPEREGTPSRFITSKFSQFSLGGDTEENEEPRKRSGPFPSLSFNPSIRSSYSTCSPSRSYVSFSRPYSDPFGSSASTTFTSVSRRPELIPPSLARFSRYEPLSGPPSISPSHLTTASQMTDSPLFYYLFLVVTFCTVCSTVAVVFLLYHTFYR